MNQRIGINVSKELKNLKKRVKTPVISTGNASNYHKRNTYYYDADLELDMDDYEDDCCSISNHIKCTSTTACIVGASVVAGLFAAYLIKKAIR